MKGEVRLGQDRKEDMTYLKGSRGRLQDKVSSEEDHQAVLYSYKLRHLLIGWGEKRRSE